MQPSNIFDVIIIGSGPSGIFAAVKLVEGGLRVAIVDKGGNYYTKKRDKNKKLIGFGGAALRHDANLDYFGGLSAKSDLGEKVFGTNKKAMVAINEVYEKLINFGLSKNNGNKVLSGYIKKNGLEIITRSILKIGEKAASQLLKNIYDYLVERKIIFFEFSEVININKKEWFEVEVLDAKNNSFILRSKKVILATGKLSIFKVREIFNKLKIKYVTCSAIDIGVRIETIKKNTDQITANCLNSKIINESEGIITRTFCWCPGGKIINYDFAGSNVIDGQHSHDHPTKQTNFGIVTTIKLPYGVDGTELGLSYIKMFNEFTRQQTGVQKLSDFINGKVTSIGDIKKNKVIPSVSQYSLVDLNELLIFNTRKMILQLISKINKIYPRSIPGNSLVYGPVLERIFPKVSLNENMESNIKGFYVVGDISGKAIGVITGAAMGVTAASHILTTTKKKKYARI